MVTRSEGNMHVLKDYARFRSLIVHECVERCKRSIIIYIMISMTLCAARIVLSKIYGDTGTSRNLGRQTPTSPVFLVMVLINGLMKIIHLAAGNGIYKMSKTTKLFRRKSRRLSLCCVRTTTIADIYIYIN